MKLFKNLSIVALAVVIATALNGCGMYSNYKLPQQGLSGEYAQFKNEPVDSTLLGNLDWREIFTDPALQGYIEKALERNVNLENARLNVEIAKSQLLGAKLAWLPSLVLNPNGASSQYYNVGMDRSWTYNLPLAASWEIGFGLTQMNSHKQAKQAMLQSEAYRQAARSQIISAVAQTYYALVALHRQHAIYLQTADNWKRSVEIMEDMKESGRYNEVAVVQARANYNSVLASIPQIESSIHETNNSLSLLLNEPLSTWVVSDDAQPLVVQVALTDGVPMKYLANRPDVAAAEHGFAAAFYATNLARGAFYPNITISAQGGFTNLVGSAIMNPGKWFLNLAGSIAQPLFMRGQLLSTLKAAKARQQQALNNFEYALLNASAEVSNAVKAMNSRVEQQKFIDLQVDNLAKAVEYNELLQNLATATYLEVISAQQALLGAQIQQVANQLAISQASINLYQSLGGGR